MVSSSRGGRATARTVGDGSDSPKRGNVIIPFCKANNLNIGYLKELLNQFSQLNGQTINYSKSRHLCSPKIKLKLSRYISKSLGMSPLPKGFSWVSLFSGVGKHLIGSRHCFIKLRKKIKSWRQVKSSFAGRSTLAQSVTCLMANYLMNCYKIPKETIKEINLQ